MRAALSLRRSEWVIAGYFVYVALLARLLPVSAEVRWTTLWLNSVIVAAFFFAAWVDSLRRRPMLGVLRDWYPMFLLVLAYREMGWLAPAGHTYKLERGWVVWDRFVLNDLGVKGAIEFFGPILPGLLEISYTLVYAMPFLALGAIYAGGRRDSADRFLFPFSVAVLSAYALFPLFPSEPPRTVFPGEDFPSYVTVFRRFNWSMLGNYGIHTSVFPSAHVSGAFSAAFALRVVLPGNRWAWGGMLALAVSIATATVYGRYHYLADAMAGLALAFAAMAVASVADRLRS